ncbi:DUF4296 domain-containing protein [uncultured Roseivirga sp.]|uniref:DUF4296 domain-containing protein n=1 Tax=uncultured Roseivirga sp. TaxID=543088 RepID=UPI0030DB0B6B
MKKLFLLAVSCLFFTCGSNEEVPEGLLTKEEMVKVMIDIRVAEGQVTHLLLPQDSAEKVFKVLEKRIFEKHSIDTVAYKSSYQYYLLNPELGGEIFSNVLDSLNIMKERVTNDR